jgi:LPXTG-site transpeptidase (sortase) family protein
MFIKSHQEYLAGPRWRTALSAALALAVSGLAGGLLATPAADAAARRPAGHAPHGRREHERRYQNARHSHPLDWAVEIPRIGVAAPVIELGGPRSGAIAVPTFAQVGDVGWYRYGAIPGQQGNAVLLGHVDTYAGPAVFYDLYELVPGDQVEVDLGPHDTRRFTVHWVKEVLKTDFPASKVFGHTSGKHLWLVTCGGQFDYTTRSYLSNIVVYTTANARHVRRPHHHRKPDAIEPRPAGAAPTVSPDTSKPASGRDSKKPVPGSGRGAPSPAATAQAGDALPTPTAVLVPPDRLVPPLVFTPQR